MTRTVAIRLKIPDNEAYTALTALRRLHVDVENVERAEIWTLDDSGDAQNFVARVQRNETLFNVNKHALDLLEQAHPRQGEVWIETLGQFDGDDLARAGGRGIAGVSRGRRYIGWRLFGPDRSFADESTVRCAAEKLLCNPAIERALF